MSIYLKEESDFSGPLWDVKELQDMSIRINVCYHIEEDGTIILDWEGMSQEFHSHLDSLETMCDEFNVKTE